MKKLFLLLTFTTMFSTNTFPMKIKLKEKEQQQETQKNILTKFLNSHQGIQFIKKACNPDEWQKFVKSLLPNVPPEVFKELKKATHQIFLSSPEKEFEVIRVDIGPATR